MLKGASAMTHLNKMTVPRVKKRVRDFSPMCISWGKCRALAFAIIMIALKIPAIK